MHLKSGDTVSADFAVVSSEKALQRNGRPYKKIYIHASDHAGYYPGAEQLSLKHHAGRHGLLRHKGYYPGAEQLSLKLLLDPNRSGNADTCHREYCCGTTSKPRTSAEATRRGVTTAHRFFSEDRMMSLLPTTILVVTFVALTCGCQWQADIRSHGAASDQPVANSEPSRMAARASEDVVSSQIEDSGSGPTAAEVNEHAFAAADHEPGAGPGPGMGSGRGRGFGRGAMAGMRPDMTTIHAMFSASDKITRTVNCLPDGAEAVTESDDENITSLIQEHVPSMESRVLGNEPLPPMTFHPIFVELIKNSDKYTLDYESTEKGVKVRYTADDPRMVMLVQEHAKLVSRFLKNGMSEIHKPYEFPELKSETANEGTPRTRAMTAKEALFQQLSGRLTEVMQAEGPAAAIEVCSREAADIAEKVSQSHGVTIGRTALKLRNPNNQPPNWVQPLIKESSNAPQFVDLPDGHTGALLPIKLQTKCLTCHGNEEIPNAVKSKLAELYPDDNATGFKEGDLRGWFWVDVPPQDELQAISPEAK